MLFRKLRKRKLKTLLYAPVIYRHDWAAMPPSAYSCWYYRWQKQLLIVFVSLLSKMKIIWKAGPRTSNLYDPIPILIKSVNKLEYDNRIRYSTKPLNRELKKCDVVFIDFPSTPMMDAIKAKKKVLCVTPTIDMKWVRQDVVERYNILFSDDIEDVKRVLIGGLL